MEKHQPEDDEGSAHSTAGVPPPDEDAESACSTPYSSAPSSPCRAGADCSGFFFSAPASPIHHVLSSHAAGAGAAAGASPDEPASPASFEFEFSARLADAAPADELFLNGRIRPTRPPFQAPPPEALDRGRDLRLRSGSVHRRARSLSPIRRGWPDDEEPPKAPAIPDREGDGDGDGDSEAKEPCVSASTSRSCSSSSSRKWTFLKELLLPRSKSEGSGNNRRERFWHNLPFSSSSAAAAAPKERPTKDPKPPRQQKKPRPASSAGPNRRAASAHARHYAERRAEAEEMRRRTYLPYRQGLLLGCLGLSSRSYGAMSGLAARTLHTVSSR